MRVTITLFTFVCLLAGAIQTNQACHTYSIPDTDELTQGPYWIDPELNRSNTTEGQQGTPFTLTLRVVNKTQLAATCAATAGNESNQPIIDGVGALPGVQVDIWHANAPGHYSGFSQEGTLGLTFLRGYQVTDPTGYVTFQTIFPGWYAGRATHIHIRIRLFNNGAQYYDDTTQLFFADSLTNSIYGSNSLYSHSGTRTPNADDGLYQAVMLVNVSSTNTGYQGQVNLYYPFATGGGGGGTPPSGGTTATTATAAPTPTTSTPVTTTAPTPTPTAVTTTAPTPTTAVTATATPTTPTPTTAPPSNSSSSTGGVAHNSASHDSQSPVVVGVVGLFGLLSLF